MVIDTLIQEIIRKKNPCIVGIDPDWNKIPNCYKARYKSNTDVIREWSFDIINAVSDIVPAVKPQCAFFEVFGWKGIHVYEELIDYAHSKNLIVIDDSKRNDIGNTSKAYAFSHLSNEGPLNADFMTVSPFLGTDSIQPFVDTAIECQKGIFILVKTSNIGSSDISNAITSTRDSVSVWLAKHIHSLSQNSIGEFGYSDIGAVVGATFPTEAQSLRSIMLNNFFLVPGFGAQGANVKDIIPCFNKDGLGAVVNSSREILYCHLCSNKYDDTRIMYNKMVKEKAIEMRDSIYKELKSAYPNMIY